MQSEAEQELAVSGYGRLEIRERISRIEGLPQPFFEYFVPPPIALPEGRTLLGLLRESGPALIFGERGSGKTMLRLVLEAYIRSFPQDTLVVSHPLREDDPQTLSRDLAVDLFVQIVEQGRLELTSDEEQLKALIRALQPAARAIRRVIRRMQEEPEPRDPLGHALHWPALGRPAVRPFFLTSMHRNLLNQLSRLLPEEGEQLIEPEISFEAARGWGFQRVFLLIDDADFRNRSEEAMKTRLSPLITHLAEWHQQGVDLKFFLPPILRPWMVPHVQGMPFFEATLKWDENSLQRLLIYRFRAFGSRRMGLDDLAEPPLHGKLDQILVKAAEGSPRRLIQMIERLIQVHIARNPEDPVFRSEDWEAMRSQWPYDPPPPPSLEALINNHPL